MHLFSKTNLKLSQVWVKNLTTCHIWYDHLTPDQRVIDDPTRVVAIIDWEGARVLPMWSCFMETHVAEPLFTTSEQYLPLRELRKQIMLDMEPGLSLVDNEVRLALVNLH